MSSLKAGASFAIALALTSLLVPSDGCGAPKKRKRSAGHDIVEDNGDLLGVFKKQEEYHYLVEGAKGLSSDRLKAVYDLMQKEQPKSELKTKIADEIKTMKDPEIDAAAGTYFWVRRLRNNTIDYLRKQDAKLVEMYRKIGEVYSNDGLSLVGECHAVDKILEEARKKASFRRPTVSSCRATSTSRRPSGPISA